MMLNAENILLIASVILFISVIAGKAGYRFGVPALLLFLGVGMLFGSDGLGIQFNSPVQSQFVGVLALSVILFSGGMDTKFSSIKPILRQGIALSTIGVLLTTILTGLFIFYVGNLLSEFVSLTLLESLLLAAVMSSTDSASVFSIIRAKKMGLKEHLQPTLELESGSNDPIAYMMTILLIEANLSGEVSLLRFVGLFIAQMGIGALSGWGLGRLTVWIMNRINCGNQSFYPILLLSAALFIFSFTTMIYGNGYLAVYIGGLMVGNHKMVHKRSLMTYFDGTAWLFQIIMFLTLGLLVNPSDLVSITSMGLVIGFFLIFLARPIAVFVTLLPFRKISFKAKLFISWVGLRGAVPIIFATYPMIAGMQNASLIFNVVFFITILSLLLQGTSINRLAKWLKLTKEEEQPKVFGIELPDEIKTAMSEIGLSSEILANGDHLMDLPLPDHTLVVLVKREGHYFVPKGNTKLHSGDKLLVISDNDEALLKAYEQLGITRYSLHKNS